MRKTQLQPGIRIKHKSGDIYRVGTLFGKWMLSLDTSEHSLSPVKYEVSSVTAQILVLRYNTFDRIRVVETFLSDWTII